MNEMIVVSLVFLVLLTVAFLWVKKRYKAKVIQAENELKFFKREKEYSSEAMMVCSKNHEILFANGAAKTLFSLKKKDDSYVIDGMAELKLATAEPIDFFDAIERKSHTNNGSFHFKDALLVVNGGKRIVNIYIDRNSWNIDDFVTPSSHSRAAAAAWTYLRKLPGARGPPASLQNSLYLFSDR